MSLSKKHRSLLASAIKKLGPARVESLIEKTQDKLETKTRAIQINRLSFQRMNSVKGAIIEQQYVDSILQGDGIGALEAREKYRKHTFLMI